VIAPQNNHQAYELDDSVPQSVILESLLATDYITQPSVVFWNTSDYDVDIELAYELDLGMNGDPLTSGTYSVILLASTTIQANLKTSLPLFASSNMVNRGELPTLRHTLTMTYTKAGGDPDSVIVRVIVSGYYDESTREAFATFRV
jgi:hypothetical protein